jgi:hypothetical protein
VALGAGDNFTALVVLRTGRLGVVVLELARAVDALDEILLGIPAALDLAFRCRELENRY